MSRAPETGGDAGMPYVRNAWYVAGWGRDFGREIKRVTVLEDNIAVYRTTDGGLVGLEDRCPHRLLPLSKGALIGDAIRCGYHGLTFDSTGACVRAPGQDVIPDAARVRSYPMHERHGIVWVWMGEKDAADTRDIFDLPEFTDPAWAAHLGDALHLEAGYLNVADNLCDPAHVSFVHPTTLGSAAGEDVPVKTEKRDDGVIVTSRWIKDAPPVGFFQKFGGFERNVDRWHYYYLYPPSIALIDFGSADVGAKLDHDTRGQGTRILAIHFLTPIDATTTIDHWMHIRNAAVEDADAAGQMDAMFRVAFAEDKEVLEAIEAEERRRPPRRPVRLAIDRGPILYRRTIEAMLAAEAGIAAEAGADA